MDEDGFDCARYSPRSYLRGAAEERWAGVRYALPIAARQASLSEPASREGAQRITASHDEPPFGSSDEGSGGGALVNRCSSQALDSTAFVRMPACAANAGGGGG